MKQRLISAGIGLVILFLVLGFFNTVVLNIALAVISSIAVSEMLSAAGLGKERVVVVASVLYGAAIPLIPHHLALRIFPAMVALYVFTLFLVLLARHNQVQAIKLGFAFFMATVLPFSLTVAVYIRDRFGPYQAIFLVLVALSGAWVCDSGAYFVGRALGRHKLAPQISPNKTIEGAIGGLITSVLGTALVVWIYSLLISGLFSVQLSINYLLLCGVMPVISLVGMLGDLSASVIKRQCGVKDFGNIMPGHGGVMDRFDSVFFTAPTVFLISEYLTLVQVL